MTNCVEYNEYKRGERNEAVVSTLRPFMAKFAEALKYGIVTLVLTVSLVYGLSQNISTLESQTSYFNADSMSTQQQIYYIDGVNNLRVEWNNATDEQKADGEFVNSFTDRIDNYEITVDGKTVKPLEGHQISSEYIDAIGDLAIMRVESKTVNGKKSDETTFVCFVKDLQGESASSKLVASDNVKYKFSLTAQNDGVEYNAANNNFRDKRTTSMRVWLRIGVTVVPILFIGASLIVQHKKFIITEEYYDMMLEEIAKRKQAGDNEQTNAEPSVAEVKAEDNSQAE